jgi:DnaJ-class molecular chaperone
MVKVNEVLAARDLLELPERATLKEIKAGYRRLLRQWHPDTCDGDQHHCAEMTRKVVAAYASLVEYCGEYQYNLSEEEVGRYSTGEEWWFARFGNQPVWREK